MQNVLPLRWLTHTGCFIEGFVGMDKDKATTAGYFCLFMLCIMASMVSGFTGGLAIAEGRLWLGLGLVGLAGLVSLAGALACDRAFR